MGGRDVVNAFKTFESLRQRKSEFEAGLEERMLGRKNREREIDLKAEELKMKKEAVPTYERSMSKEQVGSALKQVPKVLTPISPGEFASMESQMRNWGKANSVNAMDKALLPFKNFAEELTEGQGYNRYETYQASKKAWPQLKEEPLQAIKAAMDRAKNDPKTLEKLTKIFDQFNSGEVLKSVFAASYQHEQELERKNAAEKLKATKSSKPERLYETTKGWQEREDAIGKQKPKSSGSNKLSPAEKRQKELRESFWKQVTQARSAAKNIDPIMKDIDVDVQAVRKDANEKAKVLADEYVKAGGKLEDLGMKAESQKQESKKFGKYKSAEDVKAAYKAGKIKRSEAIKLLTGK